MQHLGYFRRMKGLSQEALARRVGVSVFTISRYETGKHSSREATLRKLAAELDVSIDDLVGEEAPVA